MIHLTLVSFLKKELLDLCHFRWVTLTVVQNNMKLRYKRSVLGFFWSLIGPLVSYGTMATVFYFGLRSTTENYFEYFFSGVVLYSFINMGLTQATNALHGNEAYIKKIYLPKSIYVLNAVLTETMTFLFNLTAVTILGLAIGKINLNWHFLAFPVLLVPALLFSFGFGLLFSILAVFFRDVAFAIPLFLQAAFYMSPILYHKDLMPVKLQWIIEANPFTHYIEVFRWAFVDKPFPVEDGLQALGWALVGLILGFYFLYKYDNKVVFKL